MKNDKYLTFYKIGKFYNAYGDDGNLAYVLD